MHEWETFDFAYDYCISNHSASLIRIDDDVEQDYLDNLLFYNYEDHWTSATDYNQGMCEGVCVCVCMCVCVF